MRTHLLALVCLLALASPAAAQFDSGSVVGAVRDGSGGAVAGASITLTNTAIGVSVAKTTDTLGQFEFPAARLGTYLETESSQRGQVITGAQTRALPLNGREYSSLALLTTGVRLSALNTGGFTPREGSFNVNGLRSTYNNFLIDGVDNNAYGTSNQGFSNQVMQPSPDAVAEFKVVTNNMSAEYGRSAGATINVAYASGTNRFSGAAWEFLRDTSLNATGFFKPASRENPPLERDQFGGVFGGPILKNRAFFFVDYEGFRQTRQNVSISTVPTAAARQCLFAVPVRNPLTGETYAPGTPVPMTAFARRYHAFQGKFEWRARGGLTALSSLTLSRAQDNGAGSLENPNGNFPAPQDFYNMDADFGLSAYHQPYKHDQRDLGRADRARPAVPR